MARCSKGSGPIPVPAVIGAGGGVGVHMLQVARRCGAEVAGLEAAGSKLEQIESGGLAQAVDSSDFAAVRLPAGWNGQAEVVVDLVGTRESLEWGVRAPGGRLVVLTTFRDRSFEVSPRELVIAQRSVIGSRYASRDEVGLAARLVAEGSVRPIVSRSVGAAQVDELHEELLNGRLLGRGALCWR